MPQVHRSKCTKISLQGLKSLVLNSLGPRVHKLLCVRVRFERRSVKFLVENFHESVTRPEFCDDKILSRGRNMRISIFAYWVLMVSPPPQIKSVLLRLIFVSI